MRGWVWVHYHTPEDTGTGFIPDAACLCCILQVLSEGLLEDMSEVLARFAGFE